MAKGGTGVSSIHVSGIKEYKTCPRMYYFGRVLELEPIRSNDKLSIGSGFHIGVGAYYQNNRSADVAFRYYDTWAELLRESYNTDGLLVDTASLEGMIDDGRRYLGFYLDYAQTHDDFEVYAIEQTFEVPLWTPLDRKLRGVTHKGTFDGLIRDRQGKLWVMEHKTAAAFPSMGELDRDEQAGMYLLAALQLFDEPVYGTVYNVTRKLKTSTRSKDPIVDRFYVMRNKNQLLSLRDNAYHTVQRMRRDDKYLQYVPSPGMHCGWMCAFPSLCEAMNDKDDWRAIANVWFKKRDEESERTWEEKLTRVANAYCAKGA